MAHGLAVGGDVERALFGVNVPSYVLDTTGVVRWINPAAQLLLGDIRGRHYTSVVAPEDRPRARLRCPQLDPNPVTTHLQRAENTERDFDSQRVPFPREQESTDKRALLLPPERIGAKASAVG